MHGKAFEKLIFLELFIKNKTREIYISFNDSINCWNLKLETLIHSLIWRAIMVEKSINIPVGISIDFLDLYQIFSFSINDMSSSTYSYLVVDVVKSATVLSNHF